jgi:DNA-binding MarR family transcriptional regulator
MVELRAPDRTKDHLVADGVLHHLGGHLAVVHRRIQRADETMLRPHDLSAAQARAIRSLGRLDRPVLMSELAAVLDIVPRSATSLVDDLEPKGLVQRRPDASDGRSVRVSLTRRGRATLPTLRDLHGQAVATALAPLSGEETVLLADLLRRVAHTDES